MKHKRIRIPAALLAMSLLCAPVSAAQIQTDWDQPCMLDGAAFIPAVSDPVSGIYITAVPASAEGSFCYGSRILRAGDVLPAAALSQITLRDCAQADMALELRYQPICGSTLSEPAVLTVQVEDGKCPPPSVRDSEFETYKNVANNGTLDITGGAEGPRTFTVTKEPKRGTVTLNEDGTFLYTPNKNKVGSDKFSYTVTDSAGQASGEATVHVEIRKPEDATVYADLTGDTDQFEAMWMASTGLYAGQALAGQSCFNPDQPLTRGEFLVMLMQLAEIAPEADTASTGFADEAGTPDWLRPYLAQAVRCGIVSGMPTEEGLVFCASESITCAQAAVMVQNVLQAPTPETAEVFASALPVWAQGAVLALDQAGIAPDCSDPTRSLTRREAANLLYQLDQQL